jgi:3'(2'), 5'-bisphosphate nucleotidase
MQVMERSRPELAHAVAAVSQAAKFCHQIRLEKRIRSMTKLDGSPVTNADFGSQALIVQSLRKHFPLDPIMAEETAAKDDFLNAEFNAELLTDLASAGGHFESLDELVSAINRNQTSGAEPSPQWRDRYWVIDPIDGTKGYLKGGQYAIALGLIESGRVTVAALACPEFSLGEESEIGLVLCAELTQGAYALPLFNSGSAKRLNVSRRTLANGIRMCESLNHSPTGTSGQVAARLGIADSHIDRMDSQAKYAAVASGTADIYLRLPTSATYREAIWDHAAGVLIVEEAGGKVTNIHGQPLVWNDQRSWAENQRFAHAHGVVVTNSLLHTEVMAAINSVLASDGEPA